MGRSIDSQYRKGNQNRSCDRQRTWRVHSGEREGYISRDIERTTTSCKEIPRGSITGSTQTKFQSQENAHGRTESTSDAGHARPYRADQQRNGAHRPRRLSLAHLRHPGHHGRCGQPSTALACGSASSPRCCSVWPPRSPTPRSPSSIPAPAPATTTPSRPCSPRTRPSNMPASPSSLSAGARTSTTGSIPA